jgi:hypothetical protein
MFYHDGATESWYNPIGIATDYKMAGQVSIPGRNVTSRSSIGPTSLLSSFYREMFPWR